MIRYSIAAADLEASIRKLKADWIEKAAEESKQNKKERTYTKGPVDWSDIKQAFIDAQNGKCIYCERRIGTDSDKKVEWDVEHFRPKGRVTEWEPGTGPASQSGYYLLALDWRNYMASCKRCNSAHKGDRFPIAKPPRQFNSTDPARLDRELPYLPFALGKAADDPEDLITFIGWKPVPKSPSLRKRAELVIRFFELDASEDLIEARCNAIVAIYTYLRNRDHGDKEAKADARDMLAIVVADRFEHANCARSFIRLYESDPNEAKLQKDACKAYLRSKSQRR